MNQEEERVAKSRVIENRMIYLQRTRSRYFVTIYAEERIRTSESAKFFEEKRIWIGDSRFMN